VLESTFETYIKCRLEAPSVGTELAIRGIRCGVVGEHGRVGAFGLSARVLGSCNFLSRLPDVASVRAKLDGKCEVVGARRSPCRTMSCSCCSCDVVGLRCSFISCVVNCLQATTASCHMVQLLTGSPATVQNYSSKVCFLVLACLN